MGRIVPGIETLAGSLMRNAFTAFSDGILTTDRGRKVASRSVKLGGQRVNLLGCTKGAGMIAPNMATTLSFVVTDANIGAAALRESLADATRATYNAIIVDGDMSTNDMVLVMASGAAGNASARGRDARAFTDALTELLDDLAHQLMRDGEGVHHVVTVRVKGARSQRDAQRVARSIATSPLVKTAIAGGDPNWGRILCAAGYAGAPIAPDKLELHIGDVAVVRAGQAIDDSNREARAAAAMKAAEYDLVLNLHQGRAEARYLACDLSHEYVSINADYRS
jgi:glutamate N-acetyltransferase/amino-acid N-acetyltransferase